MESTVVTLPLVILAVGLGVIGLSIGSYIVFLGKKEVGERIDRFIETAPLNLSLPEDESDTFLSRFRRQFNLFFSILNSEEMQRKLIAANWAITVSEYLFVRFGASLLSFLFGLLIFRNILPGIGLAVLVYAIPGFLLFRSIQARQKLFKTN